MRRAFSDAFAVLGRLRTATFSQAEELVKPGKSSCINSCAWRDDSPCMVKLLARLSEKRQELEQMNAARQRLAEAAQTRGEIELEPLSSSATLGALKAQLHQVDEAGMTIGPAKAAGEARPLVRNEPLRLCMRVGDVLVCGDTSVLGRTQFERDGEIVYG